MGVNGGSYHILLQGHCVEQSVPSVTIRGDVAANKIEKKMCLSLLMIRCSIDIQESSIS